MTTKLASALLSGSMFLSLAPVAAAQETGIDADTKEAIRTELRACRDNNDDRKDRHDCVLGVYSTYADQVPRFAKKLEKKENRQAVRSACSDQKEDRQAYRTCMRDQAKDMGLTKKDLRVRRRPIFRRTRDDDGSGEDRVRRPLRGSNAENRVRGRGRRGVMRKYGASKDMSQEDRAALRSSIKDCRTNSSTRAEFRACMNPEQ